MLARPRPRSRSLPCCHSRQRSSLRPWRPTRWLGEATSQRLVIDRLEQFAGPESANLARSVLESSWYEQFAQQSLLASLPSAALLLYGASGVFAQLRLALLQIYDSPSSSGHQAAVAWLLGRLVAAAGAIAGGLLFVALLIGSLVTHTASGWLSDTFGVSERIWRLASLPTTVVVIFVVFLCVYAGLAHNRPSWRCLLVGAGIAALGFEAGRWAFSAYVGHSFIATAYGPASSLVAFLLWMYYTANIVLFGAVLAQSIREGGSSPG